MGTIEFKKGENYWRTTEIGRIGFLLSGKEYYKQLRQGMIRAQRSVTLLAWDLSERIEMVRSSEDEDGYPVQPADFIFALLDEKPELEVNLLLWDYSMVYIAEREWVPLTQWNRKHHPRMHFHVDNALPVGASHHQKVVVIDEQLAFCGGFDLSAWRWDSEKHYASDSRRKTPDGETYQPLHDIQVMLEGKVVDDLSDLCASRWERAVGKPLKRIEKKPENVYWPEELKPDFESQPAVLALTYAKYKEYPAVRQIEQLYLSMIETAREYIYIENQYLSSHLLVTALAERLQEEEGPQVVLVLTRDTGGWIEEGTMGLLRKRLLEILQEKDIHGRCSVFYPHVRDDAGHESQVYVHAKFMIIDDQLVRVGSANLSNRSMKVDSEVDLLLCNEQPEPGVRKLLCRLLGVHFQIEPDEIEAVLGKAYSFKDALEELGKDRSHQLLPFERTKLSGVQRKLAETQILDPDEPIGSGYWIRETMEKIDDRGVVKKWLPIVLKAGVALLVLMSLAFLIHSAWGEVITRERAIQYLEHIRSSRAALPILMGSFLLAGLVGIPINLLLVAGTIVMGPLETFILGLIGSLLSAVIGFASGHFIGKPLVRKWAGKKLKKLSIMAENRGLLSVAVLRILPIAPFPVINLILGATGLKFRTFMAGSILGMVPGMLGVVLVTFQLAATYQNPGPASFTLLAILILLFVGTFVYVKNIVRK